MGERSLLEWRERHNAADNVDENMKAEYAKQMQLFDLMAISNIGVRMKLVAAALMQWLQAVKNSNRSLCHWPSHNILKTVVFVRRHKYMRTGTCNGDETILVLALYCYWIHLLCFCPTNLRRYENLVKIIAPTPRRACKHLFFFLPLSQPLSKNKKSSKIAILGNWKEFLNAFFGLASSIQGHP